jgi:alkylated DNA nucleotide flippase Atl1
MAAIQHDDARRLLDVISAAVEKGQKLTYKQAARLLGRLPPENNARAVAQMCDLLDAAACLAGVPLLALVAVRQSSGQINPKAWKNEYGPLRDAIIRRSKVHNFSRGDFLAIAAALDQLGTRGNIQSWKYLRDLFPGDLLFQRLVGARADSDAVDDLGTDTPDRAKAQSWMYVRDPAVRAAVMTRAAGRCELCGKYGFLKPDGTRYLESHHVIALAHQGADRLTNVIALCPEDHREAHFGKRADEIESQMISKLEVLNQNARAAFG